MLETCKRKTLITAADIKGDLNEWEDMPYSRIGRFNIKKVFFAISIKIPSSCSFFPPRYQLFVKPNGQKKNQAKCPGKPLKKTRNTEVEGARSAKY